jgi:SAM-dependent methyltransferase
MEFIDSLPMKLARRRALDFGCGVGRLTQALCKYFQHCIGVDIAPSMIELARKFNRYGDRCEYRENPFDDLHEFDNDQFDFIYSNIVLQHMEPRYSERYVQEFVRVLSPEGLAVFQIPAKPSAPENTRPSPNSPFAARIEVAQSRILADAAMPIRIRARVMNVSQGSWPKEGSNFPFHLGNHWLTADGQMLQTDDARANLDFEVKPSESIELELSVTAPAVPGGYLLELDMVQEMVTWFKDKGSETVRVPVTVKPKLASGNDPDATPSDFPAKGLAEPGKVSDDHGIEMYFVTQERVVQLIESRGGKIVEIHEDGAAGPHFVSCRYWISK